MAEVPGELIEHLVGEVASCGTYGFRYEKLRQTVEAYCHSDPALVSSGNHDLVRTSELNPHKGPWFEDELLQVIWQQLAHHADLTSDVEVINEGRTVQSTKFTARASETTLQNQERTADASPPSRLFASHERMLQALAPHEKKEYVNRREFDCLSVIAAHGPHAILQPDISKIGNIPPKYVPSLAARLYEKGYVARRYVGMPRSGTDTVKLKLKKYAVDHPAAPNRSIFTWEEDGMVVVDFDKMVHQIIAILKRQPNGLLAIDDLSQALNVSVENSAQKKIVDDMFLTAAQRLADGLCVRKCSAKPSHGNGNFRLNQVRCIQLLREPTDEDFDAWKAWTSKEKFGLWSWCDVPEENPATPPPASNEPSSPDVPAKTPIPTAAPHKDNSEGLLSNAPSADSSKAVEVPSGLETVQHTDPFSGMTTAPAQGTETEAPFSKMARVSEDKAYANQHVNTIPKRKARSQRKQVVQPARTDVPQPMLESDTPIEGAHAPVSPNAATSEPAHALLDSPGCSINPSGALEVKRHKRKQLGRPRTSLIAVIKSDKLCGYDLSDRPSDSVADTESTALFQPQDVRKPGSALLDSPGLLINPPGALEIKRRKRKQLGRPRTAMIAVVRTEKLRNLEWFVDSAPSDETEHSTSISQSGAQSDIPEAKRRKLLHDKTHHTVRPFAAASTTSADGAVDDAQRPQGNPSMADADSSAPDTQNSVTTSSAGLQNHQYQHDLSSVGAEADEPTASSATNFGTKSGGVDEHITFDKAYVAAHPNQNFYHVGHGRWRAGTKPVSSRLAALPTSPRISRAHDATLAMDWTISTDTGASCPLQSTPVAKTPQSSGKRSTARSFSKRYVDSHPEATFYHIGDGRYRRSNGFSEIGQPLIMDDEESSKNAAALPVINPPDTQAFEARRASDAQAAVQRPLNASYTEMVALTKNPDPVSGIQIAAAVPHREQEPVHSQLSPGSVYANEHSSLVPKHFQPATQSDSQIASHAPCADTGSFNPSLFEHEATPTLLDTAFPASPADSANWQDTFTQDLTDHAFPSLLVNDDPSGEYTPTTLPKRPSKLVLSHQRTALILLIIKRCGGAFPGGREILAPFMAIWEGIHGRCPDRVTVEKTIKGLLDTGKLKKLHFTFQSSTGVNETTSILAMPDIEPASAGVAELKKRMIAIHPASYVPEEARKLANLTSSKDFRPYTDELLKPPKKSLSRYLAPGQRGIARRRQKRFPLIESGLVVQRTGEPPVSLPVAAPLPLEASEGIIQSPGPRKRRRTDGIKYLMYRPDQVVHVVSGTYGTDGVYSPKAVKPRTKRKELEPADRASGDADNDAETGQTRSKRKKARTSASRLGPLSEKTASDGMNGDSAMPVMLATSNASSKQNEPNMDTADVLVDSAYVMQHKHEFFHHVGHGKYRRGQRPIMPRPPLSFVDQTDDSTRVTRTDGEKSRANARIHSEDQITPALPLQTPQTPHLREDVDAVAASLSAPTTFASNERPVRTEARKKIANVVPNLAAHSNESTADYDHGSTYESPPPEKRTHAAPFRDAEELMIAMALVRTLCSGLEQKHLIWEPVAHALSFRYEVEYLKPRWAWMKKTREDDVIALQKALYAPFLAAYEAGRLPRVDYQNLSATDWPALVAWAKKEVLPMVLAKSRDPTRRNLQGAEDLPKSRAAFEARYEIEPAEVYGLSPNTYFDSITDKLRIVTAVKMPHGHTLTASENHSPGAASNDMLIKTWCRAVMMTPEAQYNAAEAARKLAVFPASAVQEAIDSLAAAGIMVKEKESRHLPGRNYYFSKSAAKTFRRWPGDDSKYLRDVATARQRIVHELAKTGGTELDYHTKDHDIVVFTNMVAQGLVKPVACMPPRTDDMSAPFPRHSVWGIDDLSALYNSHALKTERLRFPVRYEPTPSFSTGHGLKACPIPMQPPPVNGEPGSRLPFWVDIHGQLIAYVWDMVVRSILHLLVYRPGVTATGIEEAHEGKLWAWEADIVLRWMEEVGLAISFGPGREEGGVWKGGWRAGDWWYCAFLPEIATWTVPKRADTAADE